VKLLTEEQRKKAAHKLCIDRGIDPEAMQSYVMGYYNAKPFVGRKSNYQLMMEEIELFEQLNGAMEYAKKK